LSPRPRLPHVPNNLRNNLLIFLLRALFIQDAILFILKSHTPETIFASITIVAVAEIGTIGLTGMTANTPIVTTDRKTLVTELCLCTGKVAIRTILEAFESRTVETILAVFEVIPFDDVLAVVEIIARYVLAIESVVVFHDLLPDESEDSLLRNGNCTAIPRVQFCNFLSVIFLAMWNIEDVILLVFQANTTETITTSCAMHEEQRGRAVVTISRERK